MTVSDKSIATVKYKKELDDREVSKLSYTLLDALCITH